MSGSVPPAPDTPRAPVSPNSAPQAAAAQSNLITTQARSLATLLTPETGVSTRMIKGIVTAIDYTSNPPVLSMQLGGDTTTTITAVRFLDSYSPVVGDTAIILKQGPDVLALGQVADVGTPTEMGWTTPTLNSGFTTHSIDTVRYRLVVQSGEKKIQLRGRVDIGSPGSWIMWTMPTGFRPAFFTAPVVIGRDYTGGSNVVLLQPNTTGTMEILGQTVGVNPSSTTGGSTTGGSGLLASGEPISATGSNTADANATSPHSHFFGHHHDTASHTHTTPGHNHTAANPTWVSLNGVEYFI